MYFIFPILVPAHTKLHVAGSGPMADMYRSVVGMFDPMSETSKSKADVTPCVPHPSEPDWDVYRLIGTNIIVFVQHEFFSVPTIKYTFLDTIN